MPRPAPLAPSVARAPVAPGLAVLGLVVLGLLTLPPAGPAAAQPPDSSDLPALIAAAGQAADHPGADVVVVLDATRVDVERSGLSHVENRRAVKILTARGARDQACQRFDYDPASQAIEVRAVRIHRDGGGVEEVDLGGLADVTAPAHAIYWGARMQELQLPRLKVGDTVEIETYRKGFQIAYLGGDAGADGAAGGDAEDGRYVPPMRGHFYDVVEFQGPDPIRRKTYEVRLSREQPLQFQVYNGTVFSARTYDDTHDTYRFWLEDVPAGVREWSSPRWSDYVPKVVMATVQDWREKSRWFFQVNENQFATTPAISAKVAELTEGLRSEKDRIAAINHWVAQNIRYVGHNMGEGEGYTLHPGEMIYGDLGGVCKDIAGMTITMLRAAGFEVYPAMTMAGTRVERIPADQFNHCVAALRREDGSFMMLDPTWIPFAMHDWSYAEGEQDYVIGTPEGEDLGRTDAYTAEENLARLEVTGEIQPDGTLVGKLALRGEGYADTRLRRTLGRSRRDDVRPRLERWLGGLAPNAELVRFAYGDHYDLTRPITLEIEFRLPGYATLGETAAAWRPVAARLVMTDLGGMFRLAAGDLTAERATPALIWAPQRVEFHEELKLPRGWRTEAPPGDWTAGAEGDFAWCRIASEAGKRELAVDGTARVTSRTITPDRWSGFRAAVSLLQEYGALTLTARKGGRS